MSPAWTRLDRFLSLLLGVPLSDVGLPTDPTWSRHVTRKGMTPSPVRDSPMPRTLPEGPL